MPCELTDAYDLVILLLFLIFDNDCCCRCACANTKITLCAVRFLINYFTTLGEIAIIALTNEGTVKLIESLNSSTKALYNSALVLFSVFGFISSMFVMLACMIRCEGLESNYCGYKACPSNRNMVFPMLLLSAIMMLMMDIFMFIFTTIYGLQEGERVVDFSSFGDGFRSCMFFVSIFDMVHAFVGICVIIISRNKVLNKVIPEDSTGNYLERQRYKLKKDAEYYRSDKFKKDMLENFEKVRFHAESYRLGSSANKYN